MGNGAVDPMSLARDLGLFLTPWLPYLQKAGEKAAEEAGKQVGGAAWEHAKLVWSRLRHKVEAKPDVKDALQNVANVPADERAQTALHLQMRKLLADDPELAHDLAALLDQARQSGYMVFAGQQAVIVHGSVYGLAVGDIASTSAAASGEQTHRPFMAPPLPPQGVLGRDDDVARVFDLLRLDDAAAMDVAPVALHGMGGIGKTTLAAALGRLEVVPTLFPDGVLWSSVGPRPTVRFLLEAWGKALGVDLVPERDETACRDRLRGALYHRRMLIIVDDVWEVTHGQYFMVAGPRCRTLLTTRESPIAHTLATREKTLRIEVLNAEASLALLRRLAPEVVSTDERVALRLCERLEFLPLALTLAGRFLASETDVPTRMQRLVGELIDRRDARLRLLQAEGRPGIDEDHPVSLQAILGLSVERLSSIDQDRFAMLATFGGEPLTWEINAAASVWECSTVDAEATVSGFIQRGLVERRGERYWMHALLADYAAEMMDARGL